MKKTIFFIDGFNFYHSIDIPKFYKYKWLDFSKLANLIKKSNEEILDIYFFTTYTPWNQKKKDRHKKLVKVSESVGIKPIFGQFIPVDIECQKCGRWFKRPTEKKTDVNIAVNLIRLAYLDHYDKAYIVSADGDLAPAVETIKDLWPQKQIEVVFPIYKFSRDLRDVAHQTFKLKEHHLDDCILPDPVILEDGTEITCPETWK